MTKTSYQQSKTLSSLAVGGKKEEVVERENEGEIKKKIVDYYDQCDQSYQHWGVRGVYEMHFGFWDASVHSHKESLIKMNQVLAKRAGITDKDIILDAGCGVGASSIWLAKNYNVRVVGITISPKQKEKALYFAKKEGISHKTEFYLRDFADTHFSNESFDVVWAIESVCHAPDKRKFVEESFRILKKNGRLIISDGFVKSGRDTSYFLRKWLKNWAVPNLIELSEFEGILRSCGFKNVRYENITKNILLSSKEIFKRGILGLPIYKLKNKSSIQMDHVKGCIYQYLALKSKAWEYNIIYAEK